MSKTMVEIKQLADNSGGNSIAPITVPEAIVFEDGSSLNELIGDTNISTIGDGTLTGSISAVKNKSYAFYKFPAGQTFDATTTTRNYTLNITTSGRPVFLIVSGDLNPTSAGAWFHITFYRDNTELSYQICQSPANSSNVPFCMQYLDIVAAGTHAYKVQFVRGSGEFSLTETKASQSPNFTVFEI